MLIELHVLQNFSPSCLNRDDLNAPKDCEFGGVRRARISSQCFKRAARWNESLRKSLDSYKFGNRSRNYQTRLKGILCNRGYEEADCLTLSALICQIVGSGLELRNKKLLTKVGLFITKEELEAMANSIIQNWEELSKKAESYELGLSPDSEGLMEEKPKQEKKKWSAPKIDKKLKTFVLKNIVSGALRHSSTGVDISLFGRMVADSPQSNVDAAVQVAHSISTHAVPAEFDFFTAVDDLKPKDVEDAGAGMLGSQQFNSATFYRYANVHLPQLHANLESDIDLARNAALAFAHSFITAIPNAKQNSHAAHNPPDLVFALLRPSGQPLSLANAFAKPVSKKSPKGLIRQSAEELADYWKRIRDGYLTDAPSKAPFYTIHSDLDELDLAADKKESFKDLLNDLDTGLQDWSPEQGQ